MNSIDFAKEILKKDCNINMSPRLEFYLKQIAHDFLEAVKCLEHYAKDSLTCTYDTKEFLKKLK